MFKNRCKKYPEPSHQMESIIGMYKASVMNRSTLII